MLAFNLDTDVKALRVLFNQDTQYLPPTTEQLPALNSLISQGVKDHRREVRMQILREITGIHSLSSSYQLTRKTVSVIIDYLNEAQEDNWNLNDHGRKLLSALEERAIAKIGPKEPKPKRAKKAKEKPTEDRVGEILAEQPAEVDEPWF